MITNASGASLTCLARLRADGNLDDTFHCAKFGSPGTSGLPSVSALLLQPDGTVIVVGSFRGVDGFAGEGIARLQSDGNVDPDFQPVGTAGIAALAGEPNGEGFFVAGRFTAVNGLPRTGLARFYSKAQPGPDGAPVSPKDKNGVIPSVYEEITPSTRHYQLLGITDILVRFGIDLDEEADK